MSVRDHFEQHKSIVRHLSHLRLAIEVVEADRSLTLEAAHLKAHRPLSYADAFVVALALQKGAEIVTGDPEFRQVEEQISIRWLPQE